MKNILFYFLTFLSVSAFGQTYLEEIDQDYKNWLKKGEFEKTLDFQNRLSYKAQSAFDSICYKICTYYMDYERDNINRESKCYLRGYNADTEKFGVSVYLGSKISFEDSINVSINDAAKFKDERYNRLKLICRPEINYGNWSVYKNYFFHPNEIVYYYNYFENQYQEKKITSKNFLKDSYGDNEITVSYKDINLNLNLKFNYKNYFNEIIFLNKNADAINSVAWDCLLKKEFNSALQVLERGLPLIDVKSRIYPFIMSNLAHAYLFNNQFEKAHEIYFSNAKLQLNVMSWKDAILKDFNDFKNIGINSPDMDKIKEELMRQK